MKNIASKVLLAASAFYLSIGTASASLCGAPGLPACEVPEPSTAYLFLGAIGVAAAVAKFRKK